MSQQTSTLSKFISLTTLGLLTGSSLTLTLLTTPTLLSLPSTQPASQALATLSTSSRKLHTLLANTSLIALLAAWTLSPRAARHPYLLWTALPVLSVGVWDYLSVRSKRGMRSVSSASSTSAVDGKKTWGSSSEDEDGWRDLKDAEAGLASGIGSNDEVNGEAVRDGLGEFKREMSVKTLVWGAGWMLGLVGIWGDGF